MHVCRALGIVLDTATHARRTGHDWWLGHHRSVPGIHSTVNTLCHTTLLEGLANGDSEAIGDVAGDTVVAASSALAGAATGAAIGSVVPVVGTAAGAVVGLAVGFGADYVMRKGGVDEVVGDVVSSGVDMVKDTGRKIANWFDW